MKYFAWILAGLSIAITCPAFASGPADTSSMLDIDDHDAGALNLRGAAKLKMGDTAGGQQNLLEAKTFNPNVASDFSAYDIAP